MDAAIMNGGSCRAYSRAASGNNGEAFLCKGTVRGKSGCHFTFEFFDNHISVGKQGLLDPIPMSPENTSFKRLDGRPPLAPRKRGLAAPNSVSKNGTAKSSTVQTSSSTRKQASRKDRSRTSRVLFDERVQVYTYVLPKHEEEEEEEDFDFEEPEPIANISGAEDLTASPTKQKLNSPPRPCAVPMREHLSEWTRIEVPSTSTITQAIVNQSESCQGLSWVWSFKSLVSWGCTLDNEK